MTPIRANLRRRSLLLLALAAAVLTVLAAGCGGEETAPGAGGERHGGDEHPAAAEPAGESAPQAGMPGMEMAGEAEVTLPASGALPKEFTIDPARQQLIGVTYEEIRRRDLDQLVRTVGNVEYDESRLADVSLKFHGWVEDLYVDKTGIPVGKGQELFTLYSPELVAAQQEYLTAFDHYQQVKSSQYADAVTAAERLLAAVRQRLAYWDIPTEHLRALEAERKILRALPIHSPASGYVVEKNVVASSHLEAGQLLYRLAGLDVVWVLANVYENELPQVRVGQQAEVSLAYLPGQTFAGRVTYVYPYLQTEERTVKVRVELPNRGHRLKPGMYADVVLRARREDVLVVSTAAVLDSGERKIVFLDRGEGRFEPREVTLGSTFGDYLEVLAGLAEGERVVSSSNFLLDAESQLAAGMRQMAH